MKATMKVLALGGFLLAACGGGASSFEGTWVANAGTLTVSGAGCNSGSTQVTGNQTLAQTATGSGLIDTNALGIPNCNVTFTVSGDTATANSATCTVPQSDGTTGTLTFTSVTFTTMDGQNAQESASGTITDVQDSVSCPVQVVGVTLTKISK